jgi:hypothetical protein
MDRQKMQKVGNGINILQFFNEWHQSNMIAVVCSLVINLLNAICYDNTDFCGPE